MKKTKKEILIGIGGWEHEVLDHCFYPSGNIDQARKLALYAEQFDSAEVRPTFWDDSISQGDAVDWTASVAGNPRFRFSVKLHRSFTHEKKLMPRATRGMRSILHELSRHNKLGAVLAQFPYSFTNTGANRFYLLKLGEVFSGFPLFVELRHGSWDETGLPEFLCEQRLQPVNVDLPRLRQYTSCRADAGDGVAYLRLHGRNEKGWLVNAVDARYDYLYNGREMREIKRRVDRLSEKADRVFVLFNNTTGGKGVANALQLQHALQDTRSEHLPASALRAFPFLQPIAAKETGQTGFLETDELRRAM
ncbi:MAG: DUF72 domain-containing protein [Ignavibacteria bacterium]|nr:DUF72 domain-containing protein [Ignavibacteria bacterium]